MQGAAMRWHTGPGNATRQLPCGARRRSTSATTSDAISRTRSALPRLASAQAHSKGLAQR